MGDLLLDREARHQNEQSISAASLPEQSTSLLVFDSVLQLVGGESTAKV
jgi:hypothetical protein